MEATKLSKLAAVGGELFPRKASASQRLKFTAQHGQLFRQIPPFEPQVFKAFSTAHVAPLGTAFSRALGLSPDLPARGAPPEDRAGFLDHHFHIATTALRTWWRSRPRIVSAHYFADGTAGVAAHKGSARLSIRKRSNRRAAKKKFTGAASYGFKRRRPAELSLN